ncbi:MAG: EAL domain-containing protein [Clostridia bacterium]|nr:EAL domain-containing protein [Clostridia bacterium]
MYSSLLLSTGVSIFLTILIVLISCGLIVLLVWSIGRERNRYITEKLQLSDLNAQAFDDMVKRRVTGANKNTRFTVVYIEINDAKNIREAFGEKQYNAAVSIFAERISKALPKDTKICVREYDLLAAFINEDLDKKILTDMLEFSLVEGHKPISLMARVKLQFDFNMGAANYDAQYADNADQFINNVESSLIASKRAGVNTYVIYSPDLMGGETEEYKYYQEIKAAIEANEFTLYCQPIHDLRSDTTFGFETLLRWNHKTLGVLPPSKFLNIMEQTGDILWVGNWAFEQLVIALNRHIKEHPESGAYFTMNLSAKQLMNPKLCDELMRVLKKHHAPAERIVMEIVDFNMYESLSVPSENVARLAQLGFKIALDDFGVDISSIKILKNIKADFIKFDRKFIEQSQDDFLAGGMATTILAYAEQNNMLVVAEGIENETLLDYVKGLKIPLGQGYYFGKPLSFSEYGI